MEDKESREIVDVSLVASGNQTAEKK